MSSPVTGARSLLADEAFVTVFGAFSSRSLPLPLCPPPFRVFSQCIIL